MGKNVSILEPITPKWVRDNITASFASTYLTLLSIIQGVSLGMWANEAVPRTGQDWQNLLTLQEPDKLGMRLATLLAIVIIWHAYFWLAAIARWITSIWDSLLLFFIGVAELAAIFNIGQTAWFYSLGFLGLLGGIAYITGASHLQKNDYSQDAYGTRLWNHIRLYKEKRGKILLVIAFLALLSFVVLHSVTGAISNWTIFVVLGAQGWLIKRHVSGRRTTLEILQEAKEESNNNSE